jgi:tripartite-type tricarboxylate transporter receptor subunit TctC
MFKFLFPTIIALFSLVAQAENIKFIVPYAPGGSGDLTARMIAKHLNQRIPDHNFVPEIHAGAGGAIAAQMLARAQNNETVIMLHSLNVVVNSTRAGAQYTMLDFQPIVHLGSVPMFLMVKKDGSINTLPKFLKSKVFYGSSGIGSGNSIAMAMLQKTTGQDMIHVPYKGEAPALIDVAGGNLDAVFSTLSGASHYINSQRLLTLGVTGRHRHPAMPDVLTLYEQGVVGVDSHINWFMLFANNSADPVLIKQIQSALNSAIKEESETYIKLGTVTQGRYTKDLQQFIQREAIKVYRLMPLLEPRK